MSLTLTFEGRIYIECCLSRKHTLRMLQVIDKGEVKRFIYACHFRSETLCCRSILFYNLVVYQLLRNKT